MANSSAATLEKFYQAFESRDFSMLVSPFSPGIDITQCPEVPWGGHYHGLDGAKTFFGRINQCLDNKVTVVSMIDGSDRIAVIGHTDGVVRSNGKRFSVPIMHLWQFEDGMAVRLEIVLDVPTMQRALTE